MDSEDRVVWGLTYVEAAKLERLNQLPVSRVDDLSDEELRLYAISAVQLGRIAGFAEELLAEELQELLASVSDFDVAALAFPQANLDRLLGYDVASTISDEAADIPSGPPISRLGDLWEINGHRLLHGDALSSDSYQVLMRGEYASFVFSDVPYNLPANTISGLGKHKHKNFVQAAGEMTPNEFARFLTKALRLMGRHSRDGALVAIFMSYQFLLELLRAGNIVFGRPKTICTWIKSQGGMGSLFRSRTEFIVYFKHGSAPHTNNILLGKHSRNRTTAWEYPGMNSFSPERDNLLAIHATPKPVPLLQDAILDVTKKGDVVLDPFAGSGSIILAADAAGRRAFAMELDGSYIDASLNRISKALGMEPTRASDGKTFRELLNSLEDEQ